MQPTTRRRACLSVESTSNCSLSVNASRPACARLVTVTLLGSSGGFLFGTHSSSGLTGLTVIERCLVDYLQWHSGSGYSGRNQHYVITRNISHVPVTLLRTECFYGAIRRSILSYHYLLLLIGCVKQRTLHNHVFTGL